jgi:hypothetical protein
MSYNYFLNKQPQIKELFSTVRLSVRPENEVFQVKEEFVISTSGSSVVPRNYILPKNSLTGKTDIKISADTDTNNMGISGGFDLLLMDA